MTPRTIRRASSRQLVLSGLAIAAALAGAPQVRAAPDETEAKPTRRANGTRGALGVLADALGLDHEPPRAATPSGSPAEAPNPPLATPAAPPPPHRPQQLMPAGFAARVSPKACARRFAEPNGAGGTRTANASSSPAPWHRRREPPGPPNPTAPTSPPSAASKAGRSMSSTRRWPAEH